MVIPLNDPLPNCQNWPFLVDGRYPSWHLPALTGKSIATMSRAIRWGIVRVLLRPGSLPRSWNGPRRILRFSRRGPVSGHPLANLVLLLGREHFKNFDVLKPLVP